jgi:hypothetical protein
MQKKLFIISSVLGFTILASFGILNPNISKASGQIFTVCYHNGEMFKRFAGTLSLSQCKVEHDALSAAKILPIESHLKNDPHNCIVTIQTEDLGPRN